MQSKAHSYRPGFIPATQLGLLPQMVQQDSFIVSRIFDFVHPTPVICKRALARKGAIAMATEMVITACIAELGNARGVISRTLPWPTFA
jgi:hypothetical protein